MEQDDIRKTTRKFYEERIDFFGGSNMPPWAVRKATDMARSMMNPDIVGVLSVLSVCSKASILEHQQLLEDYLRTTYGLSDELAKTWILFFGTRDRGVLNRTTQIDPILFYSDEFKVAGSDRVSTPAYVRLKQNQADYWKHLNLHIGVNSTQEDVIWFIKHYWKEKFRTGFENEQMPKKRNRELFRNSTIYSLYKNGKKVADIRKYVNKEFDKDLDDSYIRKVINEFTPQRDWFAKARETVQNDESLETLMHSLDTAPKIEAYLTETINGSDPIFRLEFDKSEHNFLLSKIL